MLKFIRFIVVSAAILYLLGFAFVNNDMVLFYPTPLHDAMALPLYLPVLLAFFGGFLIGSLYTGITGVTGRWQKSRKLNAMQKKNSTAQKIHPFSGLGQKYLEKDENAPQ